MKRNTFYLFLLIVCLPFFSKGSAYWMEIKGSGRINESVTIQLIYGNIDEYGIRHRQTGEELKLTGDFKISVVHENGTRIEVLIHQKEDCWEGTFTPGKNGIYRISGINETHPVVDRSKIGGKNIRPIDYLCTAYQVGDSGSINTPLQFLDIVTSKKGSLIVVKAFNHNMPAKEGTKLRVFNPENWEKELTVDVKGEAVFMPTMKGQYIIRQDWVDPKADTYKGVTYTGIRYRCNYCLVIQ